MMKRIAIVATVAILLYVGGAPILAAASASHAGVDTLPLTITPTSTTQTNDRAWNVAGKIRQMNGSFWNVEGFVFQVTDTTAVQGDIPTVGSSVTARGIVRPDGTWEATDVTVGVIPTKTATSVPTATATTSPTATSTTVPTVTPAPPLPPTATTRPPTTSARPAASTAPVNQSSVQKSDREDAGSSPENDGGDSEGRPPQRPHPNHPDHPDHPSHPEHPAHPQPSEHSSEHNKRD